MKISWEADTQKEMGSGIYKENLSELQRNIGGLIGLGSILQLINRDAHRSGQFFQCRRPQFVDAFFHLGECCLRYPGALCDLPLSKTKMYSPRFY